MIGVMFLVFILLLFTKMPIAFTLGISSLVYLLFNPMPLSVIPQKLVISLESFIFVALPLFILAGEIMNRGGITKRLVNVAKIFVGRFKGGLAYVNIVVSMLFGGIQGLATADTVAIGSVLIPAMKEDGYEVDFSTAVTVASSTIGAIIPPSLLFIIYAAVTETSVGALFLGGIIPGVLLGCAQMILVFGMNRSRIFKINLPKGEVISFKQSVKYLLEGIPTLVLPVLIIGGIVFGLCTPTEAAGIAVVYSLALSLITKEIKIREIPNILFKAGKLTGSVMIILSTSSMFAWILTAERIPHKLGLLLINFSENKIILLLLLNLSLLLIGTFMDPTPSTIILAPIIAPVLIEMGMNPIHIGVFLCFNLIMGLITPPVGSCLYIASGISGLPIEKISKAIIPFLIINIFVLLLITYFPPTVMFIPNLIMGINK